MTFILQKERKRTMNDKYKMVKMAGLDYNSYKGHYIEWLEQCGKYRVCERKHPERACFYCDTIQEAREIIDEELSKVKGVK